MIPALDPQCRKLVAESAAWHLLSLLFASPGRGWRTKLARIAEEAGDPELAACAAEARRQASEALYHSTFGPGGPAPPREVTYSGGIECGYLMSELSGYYRAFGYEPRSGEPPDHIATETGFLAFLRLKQAFAQAQDDTEHAAITAEAAEQFQKHHLARLATPLAQRLEESGIGYLMLAGKELAKRAGPPPAPPVLPVLPDDPEDTACANA